MEILVALRDDNWLCSICFVMAVKGVRQRNYSLLVYVDVLGVLRRLLNCCGDSMLLEVLLVNFICIPKGLTSERLLIYIMKR
jgi:hypothetical protein